MQLQKYRYTIYRFYVVFYRSFTWPGWVNLFCLLNHEGLGQPSTHKQKIVPKILLLKRSYDNMIIHTQLSCEIIRRDKHKKNSSTIQARMIFNLVGTLFVQKYNTNTLHHFQIFFLLYENFCTLVTYSLSIWRLASKKKKGRSFVW